MTTATTRLTDHDRRIIAQARTLAGHRPGQALDPDALHAYLAATGIIPHGPDGDLGELLYPVAYGNLIHLTRQLADLAERLGGDDITEAASPEPGSQEYADKYASRTVQRELLNPPSLGGGPDCQCANCRTAYNGVSF